MINTLLYTKKLEAVGLTRKVAEAHVQILTEIIEVDLATKQDLKQEIRDLESRLVIRLSSIMAVMLTLSVSIIALLLKT